MLRFYHLNSTLRFEIQCAHFCSLKFKSVNSKIQVLSFKIPSQKFGDSKLLVYLCKILANRASALNNRTCQENEG